MHINVSSNAHVNQNEKNNTAKEPETDDKNQAAKRRKTDERLLEIKNLNSKVETLQNENESL